MRDGTTVELKQVDLPQAMQRAMAKQAEAERPIVAGATRRREGL
jgi:regulator of protease activity HflC (stomatin/prohibitin superfamily)